MNQNIEQLKEQISRLDIEDLFDIYEFVDDLIMAETILSSKKEGAHEERLDFEDAVFIQD